MISSDAERQVKTIKNNFSDEVQSLQAQLADTEAKLLVTQESLAKFKAESQRKDNEIMELTRALNRVKMEYAIATGKKKGEHSKETVGSASPT
eukprot:m.274767 g.274767  ORF g.274767 m.274767 type:complete len:93 (-) comp16290_c0_seq44:174-452(-)